MDNEFNEAPGGGLAPAEDVPATESSAQSRPLNTRRRVIATSVVGAVVIAGAAFGGGVAVGSATANGSATSSSTRAQLGQGGPGTGSRPVGGPGGTNARTGGASGAAPKAPTG